MIRYQGTGEHFVGFDDGKLEHVDSGWRVVTDGLRYAVFFRSEKGFEEHPRAYLNLTDMRSEYPVYECQGAKTAFLFMSADWIESTEREPTTPRTVQ